MEKEREIKIETTEILKDFANHLKIENNKRILFSGPFGTGKSTFLNEFSETENEDFFYLKIFPVNYSISQNEDVFELIKFDLLFQLMGNYYNEIELKKEDFSLLLKSQMFIMERVKLMPLLYAILGFSEKIGTPIVDFIKALEKTVGDFKEFSDDVKVDEESDINAFLESIEQKKGNPYEMDTVSELIFDLIERIKNSKNKQSVLIIDDLDRLDPEHIFRLFNIFSAHYIEINGKNKFGFDKVIFVCDIENIRKIFHHRYGSDVDFCGYIDKFYSISPFGFDNQRYVKEKLKELLFKLSFSPNLKQYQFINNSMFYHNVRALLQALIDAKELNLRMLINCPALNVPPFNFGKTIGRSQSSINSPLLVLFYLFRNFYGSFEILHFKLKNLSVLFDSDNFKSQHDPDYIITNDNDANYLITYCLPFIFSTDLDDERSVERKTYFSEKYNYTFHYDKIHNDFSYSKRFLKATKEDDFNSEEIKLNPYQILFDTFIICKKRRLLR